MQSLQMALSVSVPLIIYMAVGALCRRAGVFSREQFTSLNKLSFRTFLPMILFVNVYNADLKNLTDPPLFLFVLFGTLFTCVLFYAVSGFLTKEKKDRATIAQGCYRSNYLLFGTIMAQALSDDAGLALMAALSAMTVPLFNLVAVVLFESVRGEKVKPGHLLVSVLKNPIIIAGICGIFFAVTGVRLPSMIFSPLNGMASAATPVALIALGGMLSFESIKSHTRYLLFVASMRLVVIPLAALFLAVTLFGMQGNRIVMLLAVFASPTAVASAPTALSMGGNANLASEIVATTSVACVATIFLFVFTLSSLGLI